MPAQFEAYLGLFGRRVANIGENVHLWSERTGEPSSTWDLCVKHADRLENKPHLYDDRLIPYGDQNEPNGDIGRGGDVVHPCYEEMQPEERKCAICDVALINEF